MRRTVWGAVWFDTLLNKDGVPALFMTRREARLWINENYGYIKHRRDLRSKPYSWRLPRAVRVTVKIQKEGRP